MSSNWMLYNFLITFLTQKNIDAFKVLANLSLKFLCDFYQGGVLEEPMGERADPLAQWPATSLPGQG